MSKRSLLSKFFAYAAPSVAAIAVSISANATLLIEPIIDFVPGSGPTANSFGIYDPDYVNNLNGEHPFLANAPGEIDTVSIGNPPDPALLTLSVWNNTAYNITSLRLSIIGSASHPTNSEDEWLITRDQTVDATFGDADGDGSIGRSNIFSSIVLSDGGKTITLSGGLIPVGGHFTDISHAFTPGDVSFFAGVDTSFGGVLAPEPPTGVLLLTGGLGLFLGRRTRHRAANGQREILLHKRLPASKAATKRGVVMTVQSEWQVPNDDAGRSTNGSSSRRSSDCGRVR